MLQTSDSDQLRGMHGVPWEGETEDFLGSLGWVRMDLVVRVMETINIERDYWKGGRDHSGIRLKTDAW